MEPLSAHGVCICLQVTFDVSSAFKRWCSFFWGAESRHSRFFGWVSKYSMYTNANSGFDGRVSWIRTFRLDAELL